MFYLRRALQKTTLDVRGPLVISSVQPTHAGSVTKAKPVAFPTTPPKTARAVSAKLHRR